MKNRIYLVTGGAGFLGSHVCRELLKMGERVRVLVLKGDSSRRAIPQNVEIVEGDLCDKESMEDFFMIPEGMESVVIHCASMVTVNPEFSKKLMDINVDGTQNIINLCLSHKECKKLVYVGSTGAIPASPKGQKITEVREYKADDERVVGWYSKSKAMATQRVLDAVKLHGLNACVVEPTGIMGPEDPAIGETTGTIMRIINGELQVGIQGGFNLADVRDLAHGCVMAVDKGRAGETYILGNEEITFEKMCNILALESGCEGPKMFLSLEQASIMINKMKKKQRRRVQNH